MSDIETRRARLGIVREGDSKPETKSDAEVALSSALTDAHSVNAEMAQALRAVTKDFAETIRLAEREESADLSRLRSEYEACETKLIAEIEIRSRLEGELAELRIAHEDMRRQRDLAEEAARSATSASLAHMSSAQPVQQAPAEPPPAVKAWILESRDAAGNPRFVRMTPEY